MAGCAFSDEREWRDFRADRFADLEVGPHLQARLPLWAAFGAQIETPGAAPRPLEMGCYGLGITRLMATIAERHKAVAPYLAAIVPHAEPAARTPAERLYAGLYASGPDVLFDDSDAPCGEKLRYADLLGIPFQTVVSGDPGGDAVEIRSRASSDTRHIPAGQIEAFLRSRWFPAV